MLYGCFNKFSKKRMSLTYSAFKFRVKLTSHIPRMTLKLNNFNKIVSLASGLVKHLIQLDIILNHLIIVQLVQILLRTMTSLVGLVSQILALLLLLPDLQQAALLLMMTIMPPLIRDHSVT